MRSLSALVVCGVLSVAVVGCDSDVGLAPDIIAPTFDFGRGTTWGTGEDSAAVRSDFNAVADWAAQSNITVFLGEFGAYSRAALDDRVAWTAFVAREAERRGFAWAYWEFDAGFGAFTHGRWNELHGALIP